MAHFTRTHTTATWTVGGAGFYVMVPADFEDLSNKVFAQINGEEGGCWAPSSQIVIDTAGMLFSTPTTVNFGGSIKTGTNSRYVLGGGASDWPKLGANHVGRIRTLHADLKARMSSPRLHWCDSPTFPGSIQTIACTVNGASGLEQPKCAVPLRVHNGARLLGATITFRVSTPRTTAPVQMPKMRIVRTDADGILVPMTSMAAGADADGWISMPKATTGSAWYASGNAQTFDVTCDKNNVVDGSIYLYWAQIQEEVGTTVLLADGKTDGAITRERKATVVGVLDGVPTPVPTNLFTTGLHGFAAGDAVLVTGFFDAPGSPLAQVNGIWIADPTLWIRRGDLSTPVNFGPGFLVPDASSWHVWECVSPSFGQSIVVQPPVGGPSNGTPIQFRRRQPRGNIYHSLAVHFDSIVDLRPQ